MSTSTQSVVERFMATFESNLADAADLMTPDAHWDLNGETQTQTAAAFVERQQADLATGTASTDVESWIIDGQPAAWIGWTTLHPAPRRGTDADLDERMGHHHRRTDQPDPRRHGHARLSPPRTRAIPHRTRPAPMGPPSVPSHPVRDES